MIRVVQSSEDGTILNYYNSINEAGRATGINPGNICACCKNRQRTAGGFLWKTIF